MSNGFWASNPTQWPCGATADKVISHWSHRSQQFIGLLGSIAAASILTSSLVSRRGDLCKREAQPSPGNAILIPFSNATPSTSNTDNTLIGLIRGNV